MSNNNEELRITRPSHYIYNQMQHTRPLVDFNSPVPEKNKAQNLSVWPDYRLTRKEQIKCNDKGN